MDLELAGLGLDLPNYLKTTDATGWIDYDGTHYHCDYLGHSDLAMDLWDLDESSAESSGRVKIYYDHVIGKYGKERTRRSDPTCVYYVENHLTQAQFDTLTDLGFVIDEEDMP